MKTHIVIFCLLPLVLVSCATNGPRISMMSDGNFVFDSLELVAGNQETVVTDANAIATIRSIIENSPRMSKQSNEIKFDEMKKLRLINSNPEKSRIYIVDTINGRACILSKAVMPVYEISDVEKFNEIIQQSGEPKQNAG